MILLCTIRHNPRVLLRNVRREKTLGEMWAAVIKNINNLLRTAWLRTWAPNGDKAGVSRCSEGDHAGHIRSHNGYVASLCVNLHTCNSKMSTCPSPCTTMSCNNRCLFFRRLKINHESHEFILNPGTVSNTYHIIMLQWSPYFITFFR